VWRLDWLMPPGKDLVTPELLVTRVRETLAGWSGGPTPPYDLLDTGVHIVHHRLARRWRAGRVFLAGDAAHLLGTLGTQGLDEGLRDADNLAWKLALAWHHGPHEALLDSYQSERRAAVSARLRAADQALPLLRGGAGLRSYVPGSARGHDGLLTDGHLGRGVLGEPGTYAHSPLAPQHIEAEVSVDTPPGSQVTDVRVTAEDGSFVRLRERLGILLLLRRLLVLGRGGVEGHPAEAVEVDLDPGGDVLSGDGAAVRLEAEDDAGRVAELLHGHRHGGGVLLAVPLLVLQEIGEQVTAGPWRNL
jgi:3-(3-hydroxy-phenyl)propionate hydroxylase